MSKDVKELVDRLKDAKTGLMGPASNAWHALNDAITLLSTIETERDGELDEAARVLARKGLYAASDIVLALRSQPAQPQSAVTYTPAHELGAKPSTADVTHMTTPPAPAETLVDEFDRETSLVGETNYMTKCRMRWVLGLIDRRLSNGGQK